MLAIYALPVSFLFGVLLAMGRMAADIEITAMRACGIGIRGLLMPIAALGAVVSLVTLVLCLEVEPAARREMAGAVRRMLVRGASVEAGRFNTRRRPHALRRLARGSTRIARHPDRRPHRPEAPASVRGIRRDAPRRGARRAHAAARARRRPHRSARHQGRPLSARRIRSLRVQDRRRPDDLPASRSRARDALAELREVVARIASGARRAAARSTGRLRDQPRAPLCAAGRARTVRARRRPARHAPQARRAFLGVLVCAVLAFGYYALQSFCELLATEKGFPPRLAAWLPNLVVRRDGRRAARARAALEPDVGALRTGSSAASPRCSGASTPRSPSRSQRWAGRRRAPSSAALRGAAAHGRAADRDPRAAGPPRADPPAPGAPRRPARAALARRDLGRRAPRRRAARDGAAARRGRARAAAGARRRAPQRGPLWSAVVGTVHVEDARDGVAWLAARPAGAELLRGARAAGAAIRRFHDAGGSHADLHVEESAASRARGGADVFVIDLDRARADAPPDARRRMRELMRLVRALHKRGVAEQVGARGCRRRVLRLLRRRPRAAARAARASAARAPPRRAPRVALPLTIRAGVPRANRAARRARRPTSSIASTLTRAPPAHAGTSLTASFSVVIQRGACAARPARSAAAIAVVVAEQPLRDDARAERLERAAHRAGRAMPASSPTRRARERAGGAARRPRARAARAAAPQREARRVGRARGEQRARRARAAARRRRRSHPRARARRPARAAARAAARAVAEAERAVERDHVEVAREPVVLEAVVEHEHLGAERGQRAQADRAAIASDQHRHARRVRGEQQRLVARARGARARSAPSETTSTGSPPARP